jgi:hypothetical protein
VINGLSLAALAARSGERPQDEADEPADDAQNQRAASTPHQKPFTTRPKWMSEEIHATSSSSSPFTMRAMSPSVST